VEQARMLVSEGRAEPHHVFGESAWVSFWIRTTEDVPQAMDLLQRAVGNRIAMGNCSAMVNRIDRGGERVTMIGDCHPF
jgi:hypothetical protein